MTKFAVVKFGDLYEEPVRNGLTRPTRVRGTGYRMVNMGELFAYDRLNGQPMELVPLNERELRVATLEIGDLLFARSSLKIEGTGKCSIVVGLPDITTFESHLIRARLDRGRADPRFYFYFFQSYIGRATVLSIAKQVGAAGLPGSKLARLNVPCPDIAVQRRIADILWQYDDLIENNRRRIQLLEQAARLLYKEWFVHLRFPGHEHFKITNGVPERWAKKPLREIGPLNYGKALKADDRIPGPFPVYGSSGVVGSHMKPLITGPTIIVGRKGNVGSIHWSPKNCHPIDTVYFIESNQCSLHLYYALQHASFISTDVAVPGLNRDFAHSRLILVPEDKIFRLFEDTAKPIHQQIEILQAANDSLAQARDLLLPRLMSGEVAA